MFFKRKRENKTAKAVRLYNKYRKLMYKAAYDILQDKQLAEDALQEAFERVIKNLHKIDEENCPRTRNFLVIIIKNVAKDIVKKKEPSVALNEEILSDIADCDETLNIVLRRETASELRKAIEALKPIYRDVVILRLSRGYSTEKTAQLLNIKPETVKKRLTRAKKMIAENMERRDNDEK